MPEKKIYADRGIVQVTFDLPAAVQAESVQLVGDFTSWEGTPMERQRDGSWRTTLELAPGRSYQFRYLIDGERWENDWNADDYARNAYGQDNSVLHTPRLDAEGGDAARAPRKSSAKRGGQPKKETAAGARADRQTGPRGKRSGAGSTAADRAPGGRSAAKSAGAGSPAKKSAAGSAPARGAGAKKSPAGSVPAKGAAAKKSAAKPPAAKRPADEKRNGR